MRLMNFGGTRQNVENYKGEIFSDQGMYENAGVQVMVGKNVQETYTILRKIGIRPQISGRGLIVYQDISPGEKVLKQSISILKAEIKE